MGTLRLMGLKGFRASSGMKLDQLTGAISSLNFSQLGYVFVTEMVKAYDKLDNYLNALK